MYGFQHVKSSAYHPQSQGQIERLNGTIKRDLEKYMIAHATKVYIDQLKFSVYSYNTSFHTTIKTTPMLCHRGKKSQLNLLYETVSSNISKAAEKMVSDSKRRAKAFLEELNIGDYVRVNLHTKNKIKLGVIKLKSTKFANFSKEYFQVTDKGENKQGIEVYTLDIDSKRKIYYRNELLKVNVKDLKSTGRLERPDHSFGVKDTFDRESHLKNIHSRRSIEAPYSSSSFYKKRLAC